MNSFKKIALVLAAALTGSVFAIPSANAAPMSVALTVNGSAPATAGTSTTTAVELPVPADNSVDAADALKFVVTVDTGTAVTVSATNASIILATATAAAPGAPPGDRRPRSPAGRPPPPCRTGPMPYSNPSATGTCAAKASPTRCSSGRSGWRASERSY